MRPDFSVLTELKGYVCSFISVRIYSVSKLKVKQTFPSYCYVYPIETAPQKREKQKGMTGLDFVHLELNG